MKTTCYTIILSLLIFIMIGCAANQGSKTYSANQAQTAMSVYFGTILEVGDVVIDVDQGGSTLGAVVGGVAGRSLARAGKSNRAGRDLATVGGAAIGSAATKAASQKPGLELTVELDDGQLMVIVQLKDDDFLVGDRVRIVKANDGSYRVRQ